MPWCQAKGKRVRRVYLFALVTAVVGASSLAAAPAPYSAAIIYAVDLEAGSQLANPPTADYIRAEPDVKLSLDGGYAATPFFRSLHWERRRYDLAINRRAGRLVMVVDLYDRIQPRPPLEPMFDTLYCTEKYVYSDKGEYINSAPLLARVKMLVLGRSFP